MSDAPRTTDRDWLYGSAILAAFSLCIAAIAFSVGSAFLSFAAGFCFGMSVTICGVEAVRLGVWRL